MKKSLLALAVFGAFAGAAQAQSSVTIYGIVDMGLAYTSHTAGATGNGALFQVKSGVIQGSRLGFRGAEDLGGGLKGVFQLEAGFDADTGAQNANSYGTTTALFRRKSVIGFTSPAFGEVYVGRQTDFTDDLGLLNSVQTMAGMVNYSGLGLNRTEGVRVANSVRYNTANYNGFKASAIYGFGEQADQSAAGQSMGLGLKYENDIFAAYANYFQAKAGNGNANSDTYINGTTFNTAGNAGKVAFKSWIMGASYKLGPARLYADYSRSMQPLAFAIAGQNNQVLGGASNSKTDTYDLGVDYSLTAPLHLVASFQHSRMDFRNVNTKGKLYQGTLGVDYYLSKRTDVYAFASYMKTKDAQNVGIFGANGTSAGNYASSQSAVALGVRHRF